MDSARPATPSGPRPYTALVVAVDGPSGAGKSSVARGVASRLGLRYLDTGSTYRALTWELLRRGVDVTDGASVAALAAHPVLAVVTDPAAPAVSVDGADVSAAIRTPEVTAAVSPVSAVPAVRSRLVALQQALIGAGGIVVEGRDIGTVVAPQADVKVYLTATARARAARRGAELSADPAATLLDLDRRDRLDSTRAAAPLVKAPGAHEIDATSLTLEQVIDAVVALARAVRPLTTRPAAAAAGGPAFGTAVVLPDPVTSGEPR